MAAEYQRDEHELLSSFLDIYSTTGLGVNTIKCLPTPENRGHKAFKLHPQLGTASYSEKQNDI